jgi:hypothetical protein
MQGCGDFRMSVIFESPPAIASRVAAIPPASAIAVAAIVIAAAITAARPAIFSPTGAGAAIAGGCSRIRSTCARAYVNS